MNIRMDSRFINGVNFVAPGNGYYLFETEQFEFLAKEPLIKYILTGHQHFDFESVYAERVPQTVTGIETARVIEFV